MRVLNLQEVEKTSKLLGVEFELLVYLLKTAPQQYHPFMISKKNHPTQKREIHNPSKALKKVQKQIVRRILNRHEFHPCVFGGVPKRSIVGNSLVHCGAACLVTMDIKDFFPRVTNNHVYNVWHRMGMSPDRARCLTLLTTIHGRLPQGAPTSTGLANLVLEPFDKIVFGVLGQHRYTRFIDDIAISGPHPERFIQEVARQLKAGGFPIARQKTRIMRSGSRQEVTGLGSGGPFPSKSKAARSRVRAAIHGLSPADVTDGSIWSALSSIQGRILNVGLTNGGAAKRLAKQLELKLSHLGYDQATNTFEQRQVRLVAAA